MHRLFVALRPPPAMRQRLMLTMAGIAGARWQSDAQLHLTLRFIGDVDRHRAEDIAAALGAVHRGAVEIGIDGVGSFGGNEHPHSLWAGVVATPALEALRQSIERALVRVGIAPEPRAFRPHITLARLNRSAGPSNRWITDHAALTLPPVTIEHFALHESTLGSGGARYTQIARFPLDVPQGTLTTSSGWAG